MTILWWSRPSTPHGGRLFAISEPRRGTLMRASVTATAEGAAASGERAKPKPAL
jgi:hypothetical protein